MSDNTHYIAISTYGKQRRVGAQSALKLGKRVAADVLLRLLPQARDVTTKRDSYRYILIPNVPTLVKDRLVLRITAEELTQVRAQVTASPDLFSSVYLWKADHWVELPTRGLTDDIEIGYSVPPFRPDAGMALATPSIQPMRHTEEGDGIISLDFDKKDPDKPGWWWIRGDTYEHRHVIKAAGGRWSKKRRAWYVIGDTLPEAIQGLAVTTASTTPDPLKKPDLAPPEATSPAQTFGSKSDKPPLQMFRVGDEIFARHDLELTDGTAISTGTPGRITKVYSYQRQSGWSYDVDFSGSGTGWCFEWELTALKPTAGIRVTHGAVVPPGALPPLTDRELKQALIDGDLQPTPLDAKPAPAAPEAAVEPAIVITPPPILDNPEDDIVAAVKLAQIRARSNGHPKVYPQPGQAVPIAQAYVGELPGNVHCFGYATHLGTLLYLNIGGPRMAVEALRARLSKGDTINLTPDDGPSVELTAGQGNTGQYEAFIVAIGEARYTSCILIHKMLTEPNYGGKSVTFILYGSDGQARAQLLHHVRQLVDIPVFDSWMDTLWEAGRDAMLVRKPTLGAGGSVVTVVILDRDDWERLITGGVAAGVLCLPDHSIHKE